MHGKTHLQHLVAFMLLIRNNPLPAGMGLTGGFLQKASPTSALVHINNLALWVQSDGQIVYCANLSRAVCEICGVVPDQYILARINCSRLRTLGGGAAASISFPI